MERPFVVTVTEAGYEDEEGVTWESKESIFFVGLLDLCGCYSEETYRRCWGVFATLCEAEEMIYYDALAKKVGIDEPQCEMILMLLNNADLLEHGVACRGSWPTGRGMQVYEFMTKGAD